MSQRFKPSPSMGVALLALAIALSGTAYAASKIGTNQIKNNAVTTAKIKNKAVTTPKVRNNAVTTAKVKNNAVTTAKIKNNAVTSAKIPDNAVGTAKIADLAVTDAKLESFDSIGTPLVRMAATDGPDEAAARAAAPRQDLFTKGPFNIYAKCFRDTGTNSVRGEIFVETTQPFSIMEGSDSKDGGPLATDFLNPDTLEADRQLDTESTALNTANYNESENMAAAPDGTAIMAYTAIGVKNGALAGDGPYGPGNACIFQAIFSN